MNKHTMQSSRDKVKKTKYQTFDQIFHKFQTKFYFVTHKTKEKLFLNIFEKLETVQPSIKGISSSIIFYTNIFLIRRKPIAEVNSRVSAYCSYIFKVKIILVSQIRRQIIILKLLRRQECTQLELLVVRQYWVVVKITYISSRFEMYSLECQYLKNQTQIMFSM